MNKWIPHIVVCCVVWLRPMEISAQTLYPDFQPPFLQNELSAIYVTLPVDSLEQMIEEESAEHEYEAEFIFLSSSLADTLESVALRLRGNTSLTAQKKSFAISFNRFDGPGKWQQLEQLNLISQHNDPSLLRSKLCHDTYRYMQVPAARTSYTKLYINGDYYGLYLNQEHIDEEFAKKYFDRQGDGNLYKCTYPADLVFISYNPNDYKMAPWGTRTYDLKTNEWLDDYADLSQLINVINNTPINFLPCTLEPIFDVDSYLRTAAADVLTGNWDNYIYNKNNFYLYHHQLTGQLVYIPYDLDNTFGIDWVGEDWAERNIYDWPPAFQQRPLFERLLNVNEYRERFSYYVSVLLNEYFHAENFNYLCQQWQNMIMDAALADPFRTLDYGFNNNDFLNAIDQAFGNPHVDYGIIPYVSERRENALDQLQNFQSPQTVISWLYNDIVSNEMNNVVIKAYIPFGECTLLTSQNDVSYTVQSTFNDDGMAGDAEAGDRIFTFLTPAAGLGEKLFYKLQLPDGAEFPCDPKLIWLTEANNTSIHINEVMAENNNSIADEAGEHADWLELWNGNTTAVNLDELFLTDDLQNWNKYPLPNQNLAAGAFKLVWLDNEPGQEMFHATFRLGNNDNDLWLFELADGYPRILNHFWPCISQADYSQERIIDGSNTILPTSTPTPLMSNSFVEIEQISRHESSVYPNPAQNFIYFSDSVKSFKITDAAGRYIASGQNPRLLDVQNFERGIYFICLNEAYVVPIIFY